VLKELSIDIAPILKIIFKRSYDTGDLPDIWKNANVSPIFKKGKRFEAVNKGNNKITELRTILQRESQNS
jgi:hypothetical protein